MKLSSVISGVVFAGVVAVVLLLIMGVHFQRPLPVQGTALYDPAAETILKGVVTEVKDFACPVSEGEIGTHLMLQTATGVVQVHLAPARIMRGQKITFARGDVMEVVGSQARMLGKSDLIVREITRGSETLVFRDPKGKLLITQW
ncbi:MAG TPA: hypothetical protein VJQ59_09170 [Candidatus Sulfotelmatobacter sp.]|nr:hypothetical protein [Candidatus Sulfotelmatobacter sp.]